MCPAHENVNENLNSANFEVLGQDDLHQMLDFF